MKKIVVPFLILVTQTAVVKAQQTGTKKSYTTVTVYTTADKTDYRLSKTNTLTLTPYGQPLETQPCVFIDATRKFQTITGIGGAITDATAETFAKLPAESQSELINAYYSTDKGIGYSLVRTNMNSCDFSSDTYTYVAENDAALKTFNIGHDEKYRIPMIKKSHCYSRRKNTIVY